MIIIVMKVTKFKFRNKESILKLQTLIKKVKKYYVCHRKAPQKNIIFPVQEALIYLPYF